MAVSRANKTYTGHKGQGIEQDAWVDENNPTWGGGADMMLRIGGQTGTDICRAFVDFTLPGAPEDCETELEPYGGIVSVTLKLYYYQATSTSTDPHSIKSLQVAPYEDDWTELTITFNNQPVAGVTIATNSIALGAAGFRDFDFTDIRELGFKWGDTFRGILWDNRGQTAKFTDFRSRDHLVTGLLPYLVIVYKTKAPEQITDLTIVPDPNDAKRPKLTWTPSREENFDHYEVWRKVGAGAWAQIGSDITVQGQGEFVDNTGGLTENVVIYYRVLEENTNTSTIDSNEVWFIRPTINTFIVSDTTPDVLQNLTFTVAAVAYPTTPTPVTQEWYEFYFGTTVQADSSSCRVRELTRTHRYPHFGSQTPSVQIENSLGFKSGLTDLTSGGPTLTVADVDPVAIIRASPVVVAVNQPVRFFGDESYAPAGNQEIAAANGYQWDKDHSGSFVADDITTLPYKDYFWAGAGTKTVALQVVDVSAGTSAHVEILVQVEVVTTVDLDTVLVDGFEVIDADRARTIAISEGIETHKQHRGGPKTVAVTIGGFAFTDSGGVANVPDDIETFEDIVVSNKRVQIKIHGTVRYGSLNFKTHHEGGWLAKYNWTADIYLD